MICPKCGKEQNSPTECMFCGIVFAKFIAAQNKKAEPSEPPAFNPAAPSEGIAMPDLQEELDLSTLQKVEQNKNSLSGVELIEAKLSGANLSGANMKGTNLRAADLSEANLSQSNLFEAYLRGANLKGIDLSGANLIEANIRWVDLTKANITNANLSGANLIEANLNGADLSGANLSEAILSEADFLDANLTGANLSEADLRNSKNLTCTQILSATVDDKTKFPDYIKVSWNGDGSCNCQDFSQ